MKKLRKFEVPNRVYKVVTMGEFFGLVSAFFGSVFSGVGAIVAALAAIPLLLLLSPLISFIFFCFFAHGLFPLRKRDLSKYSKEMQESLSEYYRKKEEKRRSEVPVTVVLTILFLVLTICCTLGVILYFQSN